MLSFISYDIEKRISKHPEKFGTGMIEGVAGPEAANNAATGGAMVPLLTLGVPSSGAMAVMLSAFIMYGIQPGPLLLQKRPDLVSVRTQDADRGGQREQDTLHPHVRAAGAQPPEKEQEPFQPHLNFPGRTRERNEPGESNLSHGNPDPIFHVPPRPRLVRAALEDRRSIPRGRPTARRRSPCSARARSASSNRPRKPSRVDKKA
jgi:hypothetical protein